MARALSKWLPGLAQAPAAGLRLEHERVLHLQEQLLGYLRRLARAADRGRAGGAASPGEAVAAALGFELQVGPSTIPGAGGIYAVTAAGS